VEPALAHDTLAHHALNLVASRLCRTPEQIEALLLASYTGQMLWRGGEREVAFKQQLGAGIQRCLKGRLMVQAKEGLTATQLGRLAAVKGLSVDTAIQLACFARHHRDQAADISLLEAILCLAKTEDGEAVHFNLSTNEYRNGKYLDLLKKAVSAQADGARKRLASIMEIPAVGYERAKRAKKALIMYEWASGVPTREIENRYLCLSGSILGLASEFSWLAESFAAVTKLQGWPEPVVKQMEALSERLISGVPEGAIQIVSARVRGLARGRAMLLLEHGIKTLEQVVQTPREKLIKLLTKAVAGRLLRRAVSILQHQQAQAEADSQLAPASRPAEDDFVAEWPEDVPPSDEAGVPYRAKATVHVDGQCQKRRYLVLVSGREAWLTEQSLEALLKLIVAAKTTELGWVSCEKIGDHDAYHQVIRRLKQDLTIGGVDAEPLIENNRAKQYRLSLPPRHITLDASKLREFQAVGLERLNVPVKQTRESA
jgi:hypothetical protein